MSLAVEISPILLRADEHGVMRVGETRVRLDTLTTEKMPLRAGTKR